VESTVPTATRARDGAKFATGAWGLEDALAVVDCAVEEIIERHSHGIIIGAVKWVRLGGGSEALVYGHGGYRTLKLSRTKTFRNRHE
jgi:3-hydroxy-9,10-secoandrosta-1,3,5(10)-triene-9,17-dione monooxygenase reductase component